MTESLNTQLDEQIRYQNPLAVSEMHTTDPETLKTSAEAALWLQVAAHNLSHSTRQLEGIDRHVSRIDKIHPDNVAPSHSTFRFKDDLGSEYAVETITSEARDRTTYVSTSVAFTTETPDGKGYTTAVYRDSKRNLEGSQPTDNGFVYSISKYEDSEQDGVYDPKLTRTQPGELDEKGTKDAETKFIALANQCKGALESKLARVDPDRISRINTHIAERQARESATKKQEASGMLQRLRLLDK